MAAKKTFLESMEPLEARMQLASLVSMVEGDEPSMKGMAHKQRKREVYLPNISPYLPISPYISLISPCISLYLPNISLYLPSAQAAQARGEAYPYPYPCPYP